MSGFDFGALRDPDAPLPGASERAGVDQRASQLRARARRKRFAATATSIVAAAVVVVGVIATTRDNGPTVTVRGGTTSSSAPTSTTTPIGAAGDRFVPPTTTENGLVVMPVTFPDGETTTLRYPPAMKIAQLGFGGGAVVQYPVATGAQECCGQEVSVRYTTIARVYGDATPVKTYQGPNGEAVPYFHADQAVDPVNASKQDYLAFQFGPWLVQVSEPQVAVQFAARMTDAERATWARSLTGTVDANGYLVLHAQAPLSITNEFEGGFGSDTVNLVELDSHLYCDQPESYTSKRVRGTNSDGTHGVGWCVGKDLRVGVTGTQAFAALAADHLEVDPLTTPGTSTSSTTTTTTTTTEPAGPASAVSASFVSATHGWVLQNNGDVAETTDGGATWDRVGSVGSTTEGKIRFADATHGFAFSGSESNQASSMATDDGGRTWRPLHAPFSGTVYDLAISHGTVYAVTFDSTPNFRIWSSPADHLAWTEDPIKIPVGAGPIPSIQLVLAGNAGWLIEVDRVVVAGARLSTTTGHWSAWTPPCENVNGPATLAAWGPTDLIASCNEGVWGSPPAPGTAVYTSHDAGATFQRHKAPTFGAVTAADPNYALLANGYDVWRTIDGGKSWVRVDGLLILRDADGVPRDLGFTTDTQGFVIFINGQMLMTYDSGATWHEVTLP